MDLRVVNIMSDIDHITIGTTLHCPDYNSPRRFKVVGDTRISWLARELRPDGTMIDWGDPVKIAKDTLRNRYKESGRSMGQQFITDARAMQEQKVRTLTRAIEKALDGRPSLEALCAAARALGVAMT